ncbi:substrate-binding domain-containing protein [Thiovibrio sp. JS02]
MNLKKTTYSLFLTLSLLLGLDNHAQSADFIIVVHRENRIKRMDREEIKQIFLGKKTSWPDGSPITIIMNTNDEIHEQFTRTVLQKSPMQLSVYWKKILYSGTGMLPLAVKDDESAKSYIGFHKNAIGYIAADSVDKQVKRVDIE